DYFIKDPVHGYIGFTEFERCIIDSLPMQRLRRILQLPTSVYVYPGATHSRFTHSIGSMHIAGVMVSSILEKIGLYGRDDSRSLLQFVRLALLTHDIGHGPYSHTFEETILYPQALNHEIIGSRILRDNTEVRECFERYGKNHIFNVDDLALALLARSPSEWPVLNVSGLDERLERSLYHVLKGSFSADILDYLLRDSYYTGAGYGSGIDWVRIAYNITPTDRGLALSEKALDAFEHILLARYHMFMSVYYHKTTRAVDIMISSVLRDALRESDLGKRVRDSLSYIELDDYSILEIPSVREHRYMRDLMRRRIRFAAVEEYRVPVHRDLQLVMAALDRDFLNKILRERVSEELRDKVFIDTPVLPLNPMLHSEEILIQRSDKSITSKRFDETTFGTLSQSVVVVRLYLDREALDKRDETVKSFRETLRFGGIRSFY
ncbi:MAG: HD domain-containing protein, partial [Sulfolobales archaeon]